MLIVFAVFIVLFTLLSANLKKLSEMALRNQCAIQLKSVFTGTQMYILDHNEVLPGPLNAGQMAIIRAGALSKFIHPYLETARTNRNILYVKDLVCPGNHLDKLSLDDAERIHFRTHLEPNSVQIFGYPQGRNGDKRLELGENAVNVGSPTSFKFLRDISQLDFSNPGGGWTYLLSELPSHFRTSYNYLYFDGRVDLIPAILP